MATAHLPESIERPLLALDRQVRDAVFTRGISRLTLVVVVGLAACLAADWLLCLSGTTRGGLLTVWGLVVAGIAWFQVLRPMFRPLSLAELAAIVESQHPELKERLTSLVEFREAGVAPGASRLMRELMAKQTVKAFERLDLTESVPTNRSPRMAFAAVVACFLLFAPFLFDSHGYGLLWARFFAPWGNFNWGSLELLVPGGDQVVAKGSDVPIQIEVRSRRRSATGLDQTVVWLHWTDTNGAKDSRRLEWDADASRFAATLPHLFHSVEFHAATRGAVSRTHRVHVADPPSITKLHLDISPPAYTGLPAQALDGAQGEIRAAERSRIAMQLEFNEPVSSASLVWPAKPTADPDNKADVKENLLPIKLSADKRSGMIEALALTSGSFAVRLKNALGLANDDPSRTLVVDPDLAPGVSLNGNDEPVAVRPDDRHVVQADIHDDYGLTAVELYLETSTGQKRTDALPAEALRERKFAHDFPIDIADLALTPGQAVTYRLRAVDNRPVPLPQETWTKPRTLMIQSKVTPTPDQQLAEQQKEVDEQLTSLRDDLADAKEALEQLHAQTEKESLKQENTDKSEQLEQLERQQAEIVERLQQLAAELAERRLTEKLAEKAANIADRDLAEALRKLDEAKETAESRDQLAPISQSIDRLAAADKQLQTLERQLDELQRLEQDLAELDRLANNAERLAEQLEQLDRQPNDAASTEERQQQLQAEGDKLTGELNDLLQKHPELLDAARQDQLDRLEQLAEQARELAKPQQQLADAFQQAAENAPASAEKPMNAEEAGAANGSEKGSDGSQPSADQPSAKTQATDAPPNGNEPANDSRQPMADQSKADSPVSEPAPASEQAQAEAAQTAAGAQAVRQQQQLAQEATRQALKLAKEQGADSEATQAAVEFAKQATEAARQAQTGQLDKAAEQAQAAAEAAEQAARELSPEGQPMTQAAQQADALAQRQEQLAEQLQQLAPSEAAERGAQQAGQQQLAQATESLAQRLEQAAENLASSPLDAQQPGEAASRAQQAASEARQAMQQAAQAAQSDDAQSAAEQASRAAQQLQQAAENAEAGQPATLSDSVVPEEVAAQVADAVRQLQQAQQQLAASNAEQPGSNPANNGEQPGQPGATPNGNAPPSDQPAPGEGQPSGQPSPGNTPSATPPSSPNGQPQAGSPASESSLGQSGSAKDGSPGGKAGGNQPGSSGQQGESGQPGSGSKPSSSGQAQPGQAQPSEGSSAQGEPSGEGQPGGKGGGSQLAQSADQFRQAAATMRRALHGKGEPGDSNGRGTPKGQGKPGRAMQAQANGEPAPPGEPDAAMANGGGEADPADLGQLDIELKKQAQRNWGKLPGSLRTEILQGASKKPHPEYAKQIKSYFEEIAKPAAKESGK